jgi:hypothetical protein
MKVDPCATLPLSILAALLASASAAAADPTKLECIAANSAGQDLRRSGKLRDAREKLALCVSTSCPGPVREDCAQRLEEVDKVMPSVIFEAKDGAGNDLSAVHVTMDGRLLADRLDGTAIPIDPGPHDFVLEAAGLPRAQKRLVLREGDKGRHERIVLGAVQLTPTQATGATRSESMPALAIISGGVGLAGLVVGVGAYLAATSAHSGLSGCDSATGTCPPSPANESNLQSFHTWRGISDAGYVIGAVGLVAGGVLFFTMPRSNESAAEAGLYVGPASCGLVGAF